MLGFGAVNFKAGAYFRRATDQAEQGFQIDLLFDRQDRVVTLCEIKYTRAAVGKKVIADIEKKIAYFPNPKNRVIEKVLISAQGADNTIVNSGYFDRIITLEELFVAESGQ